MLAGVSKEEACSRRRGGREERRESLSESDEFNELTDLTEAEFEAELLLLTLGFSIIRRRFPEGPAEEEEELEDDM